MIERIGAESKKSKKKTSGNQKSVIRESWMFRLFSHIFGCKLNGLKKMERKKRRKNPSISLELSKKVYMGQDCRFKSDLYVYYIPLNILSLMKKHILSFWPFKQKHY